MLGMPLRVLDKKLNEYQTVTDYLEIALGQVPGNQPDQKGVGGPVAGLG